jgi:DNA repair exonuclease SbcCD ATPase subunit
MDNLDAAVVEIEERIAELGRRRTELERELTKLEDRKRQLQGALREAHRHRCPHCGGEAVCPEAYGNECPLAPDAPADCRSDPGGGDDIDF